MAQLKEILDDTKYELIYLIGDGSDENESYSESELDEFKEKHYNSIAEAGYGLKELKESIKEDKELLKRFYTQKSAYESLLKLTKNKDFINVIAYYFNDEVKRISEILTSPQSFDANSKDELISKINSVRHFKLFLKALASSGIEAKQEIEMKEINIEIVNKIIENKKYDNGGKK
jgi:hypothetical protein